MVGGEVIEYISMEMGVIRLTGGEVALFHLSQVFELKTMLDQYLLLNMKGVAAGSGHMDPT